MGFSGGGSNVLLPHTHDGTVSQDGGPLDFNNITQSQSAAGEVFYSDGAHLQQLAYPAVPAGETLTAAAASTAPSWGAAASGAWTKVHEVTAGSSLAFGSVGGADLSGYQFVRVLGSCATSGANSYLALNFTNATTTIGAGLYNSQGIFGSRVVAVAYSNENAIDAFPFCFTDGTPASTVGFDFSFCTQSNGLATNNHTALQTSLCHGGEATQINWNSSACAFTSASAITGFDVASFSGTTFSPVANSVHMTVWAS